MTRQRALTAAVACELIGLAMILFINRLLPVPADVIATGLGFLLLILGPFMLVFNREK